MMRPSPNEGSITDGTNLRSDCAMRNKRRYYRPRGRTMLGDLLVLDLDPLRLDLKCLAAELKRHRSALKQTDSMTSCAEDGPSRGRGRP